MFLVFQGEAGSFNIIGRSANPIDNSTREMNQHLQYYQTRAFEAAFFSKVKIIRLIQSRMEGSIRSHDLRELMQFHDIEINVDGSTGRTYNSGKYTAVELGMTQNDIWNLNSQCSRFTSGIVNDGVFVIFSWCGYLTSLQVYCCWNPAICQQAKI